MIAPSLCVNRAFLKSGPHVKKLSAYRGPFESPQVKTIEKVCASLWDRSGKRLRSHLIYWFGDLYNQDPQSLHLYAWAAEAVHTATLLHDDVIDRATIRRGHPSANELFDNTLPILSGDYLLSDAVHRVAEQGHPVLLQKLCITLKELVSGECLQYEQTYRIPEQVTFFETVTRLKTTSLLLWCAIVAPTLSGGNVPAVEKFLESFGSLFQFSDDLLDVVGSQSKERWTDLRNGSVNRATWFLLDDQRLRKELNLDFSQKNVRPATIALFADFVSKPSNLAPIYQRLKELARQTEKLAEALPSGSNRTALKGLAQLCVDRCN